MHHASRLPKRLVAAASACVLAAGVVAVAAVGAFAALPPQPPDDVARAQRGLHDISKARLGKPDPSQRPPTAARRVDIYTLTNGHGMTVKIAQLGGVVQSIWVPDRAGSTRNVALGFQRIRVRLQNETMFTNPPAGGSGNTYFGAIIGRYANRIANASSR